MTNKQFKLKIFISIIVITVMVPTFFYFKNKKEMGIYAIFKNENKFENMILIGWDGVQRNHLKELIDEDKIPNFKKIFLESGNCAETIITTGETSTKPGWAEILTGYSPSKTGVFSNIDYKPIPEGYTVFERLEEYFGDNNITTLFISGKGNNTSAIGPHKFCSNCAINYNKKGEALEYFDGDINKLVPYNIGELPVIETREGGPYFITKNNIDEYVNDLGVSENVFDKASGFLKKYSQDRFFMFMHFVEPDMLAHHYGENSSEYGQSMIYLDGLLGDLITKLKELNISDKTIIYLTTDHGINEGEYKHDFAPETFLCSSEKKIENSSGDRKDITPTILLRYGLDINEIKPPLDGKSLIKSSNN